MNKTILEAFDIRRMRRLCNFPSCSMKPEKEILVYKYTLKSGKKGLVTLYLCKNHIAVIDDLIKKLKEESPKIIIDKEVKSLGQ